MHLIVTTNWNWAWQSLIFIGFICLNCLFYIGCFVEIIRKSEDGSQKQTDYVCFFFLGRLPLGKCLYGKAGGRLRPFLWKGWKIFSLGCEVIMIRRIIGNEYFWADQKLGHWCTVSSFFPSIFPSLLAYREPGLIQLETQQIERVQNCAHNLGS